MNNIKKLIIKHKEFISYGFWGVITTLLHLLLFWLLTRIGIKYYISNIIVLITIKSLAYIINKMFVFKTKCKNKKELIKEIIKYILSRLLTMIIDYFGLILLVEIFNINELISKLLILILVVIINYILCKKIVYRSKGEFKMKNKILKSIKKNWFIYLIIIISLIRFLYTINLPNFYLSNLGYDDNLMIRNFNFLKSGNYLGPYYKSTLVKGPMFSIIIFIINLYKVNYCNIFSLLYILASLFLTLSLKDIIKNKKYLVFIYLILLFNPASYSQDLFQRLYRNSISITEFIFFFACVIRVLFHKYKKILYYSLLGISLSFMFLTREDNLWVYPILLFIIIYTIIKNKNIKTIFLNIIPIIILIGSLNLISYINYKHYGIYTYNEIQKSEFHNTYKKILQIKDNEKKDKVAISKSTLYLLANNTKSFKLTKEDIDDYYKKLSDKNDEIYNGNIIWYFRDIIYCYNKFHSGIESEKYYKKLGKEIDKLFEDGTLEKEFVMPSIYMSTPTNKDLKQLPSNLLYAIGYSTTYKNIKTMTKTKNYEYDKNVRSYYFEYKDYHNTVNITKNNPLKYELIRLFYKYFTIIFSIISLIIYLKNILKFDKISIISHILLVTYLLIIGGITYTHTTSFHAIRPLYLGNIYLIQSIFILMNISRINKNKLFNIIKVKREKM